jgi:hypothetical protein
MIELLVLGGLVGVGLLLVGVAALTLMMVKLVFLLVLWPLRLAFKLVLLPFKLVLGLLVLPFLAIGLALGTLALLVSGLFILVAPLLPILVVGLIVWLIVKAFSRPVPTVS